MARSSTLVDKELSKPSTAVDDIDRVALQYEEAILLFANLSAIVQHLSGLFSTMTNEQPVERLDNRPQIIG